MQAYQCARSQGGLEGNDGALRAGSIPGVASNGALAPFGYRIARDWSEEILQPILLAASRAEVQKGSRGMAGFVNAPLIIHESEVFSAVLDNLSQGIRPSSPLRARRLLIQRRRSQQRVALQARHIVGGILRRQQPGHQRAARPISNFDRKGDHAIQCGRGLIRSGFWRGWEGFPAQFHLAPFLKNLAPQVQEWFLLDCRTPFFRAVPGLREHGRYAGPAQHNKFRLHVMPRGAGNLWQDRIHRNTA